METRASFVSVSLGTAIIINSYSLTDAEVSKKICMNNSQRVKNIYLNSCPL